MPTLSPLKGKKNRFWKVNSFIQTFNTHTWNTVSKFFYWEVRPKRKITQLDTTDTLENKLFIAREFQMPKESQQQIKKKKKKI